MRQFRDYDPMMEDFESDSPKKAYQEGYKHGYEEAMKKAEEHYRSGYNERGYNERSMDRPYHDDPRRYDEHSPSFEQSYNERKRRDSRGRYM